MVAKFTALLTGITILLISFLFTCQSYAQTKVTVRKTFVQNGYVYQLRQRNGEVMQAFWWPVDYKWTEQAWTGNDAQYRDIATRVKINAMFRMDLLRKLSRVRASLSEKSSPQDRFYFACLVDAAMKRRLLTKIEQPTPLEVAIAFMSLEPRASTPTNDRLRLLLEMGEFPSSKLLPIAARLLQRDPEDYEVRLRYAKALSLTGRRQDCEKAVDILEKLRVKDPEQLTTLTYLGSTLWHLSDLNHRKETLQKASDCYVEYLQKAPSDDSFRSSAQRVIKVIGGELKRWGQK